MPGGEYTTVCFVDDYEELLTRVGHDFTLDVEELWTSHQVWRAELLECSALFQESRRNPECVLALYMAVARACFPDDQANRILNIGMMMIDATLHISSSRFGKPRWYPMPSV